MSYWWEDTEGFQGLSALELALHKVFQNRGFSPINRTLSPPDINHVDSLTAPDLQNKDILKWGRLFSADVVICGQGNISDKKEMSLTLRALDVSQVSHIKLLLVKSLLMKNLSPSPATR